MDARAAHGNVLVTGRSQAGLDSMQKELGKGGVTVSSDARSLTDIDALASRVKAEFDTSIRSSSTPGSAPPSLLRA
jgi:short-subunit dehydrogenase involved in D-alanine esterification of teichoic acids